VGLALASVTIAAGAMVVFALEGLICIGMALPIAWAIALPGAVLGRVMARRGMFGSTGAGMALVVPLLLGVEPRATPADARSRHHCRNRGAARGGVAARRDVSGATAAQ
jgi:hypothetical protein